jgi:hypothetical protein
MKIKNERTLDKFRTPRSCENCFKPCKPDPHHLWQKGLGGGGRIDLAINLIALCRVPCHMDLHAGLIERDTLLGIVARREGTSKSAIESVIDMIRRLPKDASQARIRDEIGTLDDEDAMILAVDELRKAGVLR